MTAPGAAGMQAKAAALGATLAAKVKALTPATRIAAIVAVLAIGAGGYVFVRWVGAPTYAPLFSNLAAEDASAVIDQLNTAGIPYQIGANGSEIMVPKQDVYAQRIALSADGLPSSPQTGYSLLDSEGVTTSEFRQRIDYQRALEGELANTIGAIDGVEQAQVHLAMPAHDVFDDGTQKTTAAVLLTLRRGATLSGSQTSAVVNLVASSVPGLSAEGVTVTDSAGSVLAAGGETPAAGSGDQLVDAYRQRVTDQLQTMLDKLVGPGKALVSVNADLDASSSTTTSHTYTEAPGVGPIAQSTTSEIYSGAGAQAAGGVAGVTAAATPAATTAGGGSGNYSKTSNTQNNPVGTVDSTTEKPPGEVKRLSVAVVLDDSVAASVTPGAVTELVNSAAGIDATRGDTVSVQKLAMDSTATDQAAAAATAAQQAATAAKARSSMVTMLSAAGAAAVVVVIAIALFFHRRSRRRPGGGGLDDLTMLIEPEDHGPPPEPEPLVPDRPWTDQSLDVTRKELHNLAVDKPGDVAKVLRTWLSD